MINGNKDEKNKKEEEPKKNNTWIDTILLILECLLEFVADFFIK